MVRGKILTELVSMTWLVCRMNCGGVPVKLSFVGVITCAVTIDRSEKYIHRAKSALRDLVIGIVNLLYSMMAKVRGAALTSGRMRLFEGAVVNEGR